MTDARCECGWQAQLSKLYAGKRIRCPQCERVVEIPGQSSMPLYDSPLPAHQSRGRWVPVKYSSCARGHCGGGGFFVVIVLAIALIGLLNQCSREPETAPRLKPSEKSEPQPLPSPQKEEKF